MQIGLCSNSSHPPYCRHPSPIIMGIGPRPNILESLHFKLPLCRSHGLLPSTVLNMKLSHLTSSSMIPCIAQIEGFRLLAEYGVTFQGLMLGHITIETSNYCFDRSRGTIALSVNEIFIWEGDTCLP